MNQVEVLQISYGFMGEIIIPRRILRITYYKFPLYQKVGDTTWQEANRKETAATEVKTQIRPPVGEDGTN